MQPRALLLTYYKKEGNIITTKSILAGTWFASFSLAVPTGQRRKPFARAVEFPKKITPRKCFTFSWPGGCLSSLLLPLLGAFHT